MDLLNHLSYWDSILLIVGAGLLVHLVFKRTETHEPVYLILLLLGLPAVLSGLISRYYASLISSTTLTFITYWGTLVTSILLYRLSPWHPLARYPGPLICRVSKLWLGALSLRGKQHIYYFNLHQKYGDIVRVGPNELSFRNVDAVAPLIGPTGLPKGPFWDGRTPEDLDVKPMIALRDKREHMRRRRPWTRAFSTAALKGYERIITNRCLQLMELLGNQTKVVNMTQWMSFFSYDLMNDLAFGGGTEMMRDGDVDGLWHLLEASQKFTIFMSHVPWLGALFFKLPYLATDRKAFQKYAADQAIARKKRGSPYRDVFHYLFDEDGVAAIPPTPAEAVNDAILVIVGGSDTTSSTITNLFYLLSTNPVAYKRLQSEIDELGGNVTDFERQAHMPYLNSAINESLRLFPPVLSGTQRYVDSGIFVGVHYVPEGTTVFIPFFSLHRDPRNFAPLVGSFLPERWLPSARQLELEPVLFKDKDNVVLNADAFIPFSFGPSNCVGKNLAWIEMRMLVCLIMQKFDMRLEDSYRAEQWEEGILDYFVMMKGELPIILTPRK